MRRRDSSMAKWSVDPLRHNATIEELLIHATRLNINIQSYEIYTDVFNSLPSKVMGHITTSDVLSAELDSGDGVRDHDVGKTASEEVV